MIELILTAVLFTAPTNPAECPDPARPIHYPPYCLTEAEYQATLPKSPPTPVSVSVGVEQWRPMVDFYWGKHGKTDLMLAVMDCESGGDPNAKNPYSTASGLYQILDFWHKKWAGNYFDPWVNAATAYQIWLSQGIGAWNASRSCWG